MAKAMGKEAMSLGQRLLMLAGFGLAFGAAAHVAGLALGPTALAFMGAPPSIVQSAESGSWLAPAATLGIAGLSALWAAFAFASAGMIRVLPLSRPVLWVVAIMFLLRGALVFPMALQANWRAAFDLFHVAASAFVLALGVCLGIGLTRARAV